GVSFHDVVLPHGFVALGKDLRALGERARGKQLGGSGGRQGRGKVGQIGDGRLVDDGRIDDDGGFAFDGFFALDGFFSLGRLFALDEFFTFDGLFTLYR